MTSQKEWELLKVTQSQRGRREKIRVGESWSSLLDTSNVPMGKVFKEETLNRNHRMAKKKKNGQTKGRHNS